MPAARHPDRAHPADPDALRAGDRALPQHDRPAVRRESHDPADRSIRRRTQSTSTRSSTAASRSSRPPATTRRTSSQGSRRPASPSCTSAPRSGTRSPPSATASTSISIDGFECAGHPGEDDIPGPRPDPGRGEALKIPVDRVRRHRRRSPAWRPRSRWVRTASTWARASWPRAKRRSTTRSSRRWCEPRERDTNLIFRTLHNTARVLKNAVSDEVVAIERRGGAHVRRRAPARRSARAVARRCQRGDVNGGIVSAGMVVGLIDDVPTCAELIERIVRECRERLQAASVMADS